MGFAIGENSLPLCKCVPPIAVRAYIRTSRVDFRNTFPPCSCEQMLLPHFLSRYLNFKKYSRSLPSFQCADARLPLSGRCCSSLSHRQTFSHLHNSQLCTMQNCAQCTIVQFIVHYLSVKCSFRKTYHKVL